MAERGLVLCSARDPEWLALRHQGIGASDMPKVLGVSRWGGPLALWEEKIGPAPNGTRKPTGRMARGHAVEPLILQMVADRCGYTVYEDQQLRRHPGTSWMRATIDGRTGAWLVIECKSVAFAGDLPDELPLDWSVQVQQQLEVTGARDAIVAALAVVDWELRVYHVERDDDFIRQVLIPAGAAFWQAVQDREEPPLDYSEESMAAWRRLHGVDDGGTVDLDLLQQVAVDEWQAYRATKKEAEAGEERCKVWIQQAMGTAAYGNLPDGRQLTYKTEKSGRRVLRLKDGKR